jgi:hypothetical protein
MIMSIPFHQSVLWLRASPRYRNRHRALRPTSWVVWKRPLVYVFVFFLLFGLVCQSHDHHSHNHHCHCHIARCRPLHSSASRPTPRYNRGGRGALVSLSSSSSSGKFHDIWKFHVFHANLQQQQQSALVPNNAVRAAAACSGGHIFVNTVASSSPAPHRSG